MVCDTGTWEPGAEGSQGDICPGCSYSGHMWGRTGVSADTQLELDTKTERTLASDWSRDRVLASDWPPSGADNDYMGCVASIDRLALFFTASEVLLSEVLLRKSLLPGQAELG